MPDPRHVPVYTDDMTDTQRLALEHVERTTQALETMTEQRHLAIEAAQAAGCTNVQIAKAAGISERGIYKLLERRRLQKG